jgi:zinc transport system substrate-binding protein
VFFERLVSPKLAQTVAREAGAKTAVLDPIEGLTPAEEQQGLDYIGLMRQNLQALRKELRCR